MARKSSAVLTTDHGENIGQIIRRYRIEKNMSQEELGALTGVGKNAVGAWEKGRSRPDLAAIPAICHALKIPYSVLFGSNRYAISGDEREFLLRFRKLNTLYKNVILKEMDALTELQNSFPVEEKAPQPVRTIFVNNVSAAAGFCYDMEENGGQSVSILADSVSLEADEIITVNGDSMEPVFKNGDMVFVKHIQSVRPGEIGIFVNGNTGYIKEYREDGLYSYNPVYPVMHFCDTDEVRCIGKVLGKVTERYFAIEQNRVSFTI